MKRHSIKVLGKQLTKLKSRKGPIDNSCGCGKPLPKPITKKGK